MFNPGKAFDRIAHDFLKEMLFRNDFMGKFLGLSEIYLENRCQLLVEKNRISSFANVNNGIPQSSVLGLVFDFGR